MLFEDGLQGGEAVICCSRYRVLMINLLDSQSEPKLPVKDLVMMMHLWWYPDGWTLAEECCVDEIS